MDEAPYSGGDWNVRVAGTPISQGTSNKMAITRHHSNLVDTYSVVLVSSFEGRQNIHVSMTI